MIAALKISHLEQLNNEIFALLPTRFSCLKIDYLVKRIGISIKKQIKKPDSNRAFLLLQCRLLLFESALHKVWCC